MVRRALLVTIALALLTVGLAAGSCINMTDSDRTMCYNMPVNSTKGFGAVELCGDCYVCGLDDGVCPEDFYVEGLSANCSNCADPDCLVTISGYITAEDTGIGVNGVELIAQVLHLTDWATTYRTTTAYHSGLNGYYNFTIPRGNYRLAASKFGYETRLVRFPLSQGKLDNYFLNFSLGNGTCHTDCSGYVYEDDVPRCSATCEGFTLGNDNCTYPSTALGIGYSSAQIAQACAGMPVGSNIPLEILTDNSVLMVKCCEGPVQVMIRPRVSLQQQFDRIKNLITRTLIAEKTDEAGLVKVNIVIYNKAENS